MRGDLVFVVISLACFAACRGDGQSAIDATTPIDAPAIDASRPWDECTNIESHNVPHAARAAAGPAPTPAGNPVVDGRYRLTDYAVYEGVPNSTDAEGPHDDIRALEGGVIQFVNSIASASGPLTVAGTTLTFELTCFCRAASMNCTQIRGESQLEYTATATTIAFFTPHGGGGTVVMTFTLE